ncbi:MAG: hypothetical protein IJU36_05750 [Paludibacteraceae bacterium]|nr:hypothetical protein [Paludibacteraceae bacterium]
MKTKYLIPQTEALPIQCDDLMDTLLGTPGAPEPAPQRGFAPGGGDLGGVPAN